ncbi:MAG TPA: hypothetical protein PKD99_04410 [Sphingopyxis sp.]|nr:hypothetical protein [Sphingopyxis sp.]HMP44327.1 hypothetical protein [Sphingopyxis sp.]HMQ19883.1 hypothetical protein [Sphingopyxis sp.]
MTRWLSGAVLAACVVWAAPAAAQSVSIKDPAAFRATLDRMGYAPTPLQKADTTPEFDIEIDGFATTLRLQKCEAGRNCGYMTLVASYSDVLHAPQAWVQQMNDEFDMLRIGTNDRGQLYMFGAYVVEGLPQRELKRIFDYWAADTAAIAEEANAGGHAGKD